MKHRSSLMGTILHTKIYIIFLFFLKKIVLRIKFIIARSVIAVSFAFIYKLLR